MKFVEKLWRTAKRTILFFALVHLVYLLIVAVTSGQWHILRITEILDFPLIVSREIIERMNADILFFGVVAFVFTLLWRL